MACGVPRAIEDRCGLRCDSFTRRHGQDLFTVRRARVDAERFLAYRHRLATRERMPVVIFDLAPRSAIDDRLVAVEASTLLAFERAHRERAKLDSFDGTPRNGVALEDLDAVKARLFEGAEELVLFQCARHASAPELRIVLQMVGDRFVGDDIRDDGAAAAPKHPERLGEDLALVFVANQVEDAIRHDDVNAVRRDQRIILALLRDEILEPRQLLDAADGMISEPAVEAVEIYRQVLEAPAPELNVAKSQLRGHCRRMTPRERQHLGVHVDTDDASRRTNNLSRDKTRLASAAAEIQNPVARLQVWRRIAASVVALDHFARYRFEIAWIVAHRAAQRVLPRGSPCLVALPHHFVDIQLSRH